MIEAMDRTKSRDVDGCGMDKLGRRSLLAGISGALLGGPSAALADPRAEKRRKRSGKTGATKPDTRSNVVLIVSDDMRARDWSGLPLTRKRLRDGSFYQNYIVNNPICTPSRATMLTGLYSHNHGLIRNAGDDGDAGFDSFVSLGLSDRTIAVALKESGYQTAMIGKYMNGYEVETAPQPGWSRWVARSSFDYTDFELRVDDEVVECRGAKHYVTDVLGNYACDFIRTAVAEQPLFLYLSMNAPHAPSVPAPRHQGLFPDAAVERDPSFNEADVSDKPYKVSRNPPMTPEQIATIDQFQRQRLQTLAALDEAIVKVIDTLDATGRLPNTHIMVVSDNGLMMGQHRAGMAKGVPYDGAIRIPMLAWGEGFPNREQARLVSNVDLVPTIAEIAGVRFDEVDGFSLFGTARREYALVQTSSNALTAGGFGLRSARLLYFEHASGEREYYDYMRDPLELANLVPLIGSVETFPLDLPRPGELKMVLAHARVCSGKRCP